MLNKSLKRKIIIPMIFVLLTLVAVMTFVSSKKFSSFNDEVTLNKLEILAVSLKYQLEASERRTLAAAVFMADSEPVKQAIADGKTEDLMHVLITQAELLDVDYFTVCDEGGKVLARTHSPEQFGDLISGQQNIKDAMDGKISTYYEEGSEVKVSIRTGAPIYSEGILIGIISAGVRLDTNEFVDNIKNIYSVDVTVFLRDIRCVTTIVQNGQRITGIKLNSDVADVVLNSKREYYGESDVFGMRYKATYIPLMDANNKAFAVISAGAPLDEVTARIVTLICGDIVAGGIMFAVSIVILILVVTSVSKPLSALTEYLKDISNGNMSAGEITVNSQDEVGQLSASLQDMIRIFRRLINDTNKMAEEREKGDIDYFIDTGGYKEDYRTFAENINKLLKASHQDTMNLVNLLMEFGEGNFDADVPKLPGKKALMNQRIDLIRDKIKGLISEINGLSVSIIGGNFSARADESKYFGDWKKVIIELNRLVDITIEPIIEAASVLKEIEKGNLNVQVTGMYKGDHAVIKNSLNSTAQGVGAYIKEISGILERLAAGDLNQAITMEYVGDFKSIKESLNNIINKLNDMISDISIASEQLAAGSMQISNSSMTLSQGSVEQTSSIEQLTSMVELVDDKIKMNASNAKKAVTLSEKSRESVGISDSEMKEMLKAMDKIKESSKKILKVIKMIEEIAFQTNMLALNATVEAARAGIYGKGFGVVAEEVRSLADRCKAAAHETTELIEGSLHTISDGIQIAIKTADNFEDIVSNIEQASLLITEISNVADDQANSISAIHQNVSQIGQIVQVNSSISEESAAAAQELSGQSEAFKIMMNRFKLKVKK